MPIDLFSDALQLVGAQTALAGGFAAGGGPWALRFPAPDKIKFAAVVGGACWLRIEGAMTRRFAPKREMWRS